mgnify:CR=1 FL=1
MVLVHFIPGGDDMKNEKQTCANCEHGRWALTPTGRIMQRVAGRCDCQAVIVITLPACCSFNGIHRHAIWREYTDCPLWKQLDGKPKPIDGTEPKLGVMNETRKAPRRLLD